MLWVTVPQIIVELLLNHIIFGSKLYGSRRDNMYIVISLRFYLHISNRGMNISEYYLLK